MKFKVLVASRYNNTEHVADNYAQGDTLETGEAYGQTLVLAGYVEPITEVDTEEVEPTQEPGKLPVVVVRRSRPKNSFVPNA